jgi:hypothetical protein
MYLKINIDDSYDSSDLLFSIPIHEKQDIINNQIENILNYNPKSKIILHVNKSFKSFNSSLTQYNNVYVNSISLNYEYAKGLLLIHINNFLEAIKLNIDFKYFIILSSNEMFIKNGLIHYIKKYKNGLQIVEFNKNIEWHNFHKNIEKDTTIINMINELNLNTIYGGQTEGQFYEKYIFQKISDIYLKYFGNKELNNFETEEIVVQTIFKSFNIDYTKPFTLQNYSNNLIFDINFIDNIITNNIIIPNNNIKNTLISPHVNNDSTSIFSIKRVERSFNNIRNHISRKGFILNKDIFQLNTQYYSNNSSIIFFDKNYIQFNKKDKKDFNWFGFELDEGFYSLNFDIKIIKNLLNIKNYKNIGLKIHKPYLLIYNFFLEDLNINIWKNITIPLHIKNKQTIIFIFDDYVDDLSIQFKNFNFNYINKNNKENIALLLYENNNENNNENINNDYSINYTNIKQLIIEPLSNICNIYIFSSLYNINKLNNLINCYKPCSILLLENTNINEKFILNIDNINYFKNKVDINFNFLLTFSLDSIFKKSITEFNFFINKFNFISYHIPYYDNKISNSYDFMSIPFSYIKYFYDLLKENINNSDICYSIYHYLSQNINKNSFNFIIDDNYETNIRTPLIKYLSDINNINNNDGYLIDKKYFNNIFYYNKYSKILKNINNEFYFYKKKILKFEDFQWIGIYLNDIENLNITENITISFDIKFTEIMKNINNNNDNNFGLKIHNPIIYLNDWIKQCIIDEYVNIVINTNIIKKNQYIILNFDNYLDEIEFYIKNFKIILEYK